MKPSRSDLALEVLYPRLNSAVYSAPDAALRDIQLIRKWVKTLPGWRIRWSYQRWLDYFERTAKEEKRRRDRREAIESAVKGFPRP